MCAVLLYYFEWKQVVDDVDPVTVVLIYCRRTEVLL